MAEGYLLGKTALRQIRDLIRQEMLAVQQTPNARRDTTSPISIAEGTLAEDLAAGSFSSVVTADMTVHLLDVTQDSRVYSAELKTASRTITLVNRDDSLTGSSGDYCIAMKWSREWRPIWVGCS